MISSSNGARKTVVDHDTQEHAGKPENGAQKAESLSSLPLVAITAPLKATPVPDAAAAGTVEPSNEKTKGGKPTSSNEEIKDIVDDGAGEWDHQDQRGNDGDDRPDNGVDKASIWALAILAALVEEVGGKTKNDSRADKLGEAEANREHSGEDHDC